MPIIGNNKLVFSSQDFYLRIEVYKKPWLEGIICNNNLLKRFSTDPEYMKLSEYL